MFSLPEKFAEEGSDRYTAPVPRGTRDTSHDTYPECEPCDAKLYEVNEHERVEHQNIDGRMQLTPAGTTPLRNGSVWHQQ